MVVSRNKGWMNVVWMDGDRVSSRAYAVGMYIVEKGWAVEF